MSDAASKITGFENQVMKRKQMLALQDRLALAIPAGSVAAATIILLAKMREGGSVSLSLIAAIFFLLFSALLFNWFRTRAGRQEAAFLIDNTLNLEDRLSTAHEIIEKGGPRREVEMALVDDAADRITGQRASAIVPYRIRKWYAISLVGIAALVAALMIPQRVLPGGEAIVEARANIQTAGEQLQQASEEVVQAAPTESETAKLAKEQSELGRMFRVSPETRAEALKKLSALEDRIRKRHSDLAETRADEIVDIAQQRLQPTIRPAQKQLAKDSEIDEEKESSDQTEATGEDSTIANSNAARLNNPRTRRQNSVKSSRKSAAPTEAKEAGENKNSADDRVAISRPREATSQNATRQSGQQNPDHNQAPPQQGGEKPRETQASNQAVNQGQGEQSKSQNRPQEPVSGNNPDGKNATAQQPANANPPTAGNSNRESEKQAANNQGGADQGQANGEQNKDENKNSSGGLTGFMAEQAAKALPKMSEELLKKAAQLRAGQLSAEDIKGLQHAAENMARDLSKIAQSKELQQAAEQLARQITPEQIEQFARQLGNVEQLKQELEASARLMMQNQQAKSMVAGLAQKFAKIGEEFGGGRRRNEIRNGQQEGSQASQQAGNGQGKQRDGGAEEGRRREFERMSGGLTARQDGALARTGAGKESKLTGKVQRGTGGEFLYLKSQSGSGSARAPYSSAYPQYRREAERSVERSQVPPHMRSIVRSYFDAINPDSAKKP